MCHLASAFHYDSTHHILSTMIVSASFYELQTAYIAENYLMSHLYTLDNSDHTGTTEIVQAIKRVEENIENSKEMRIWDQTIYL